MVGRGGLRLGLGLKASMSSSIVIGVVLGWAGGGLEVKMGSILPSEGISGPGGVAMRASSEHLIPGRNRGSGDSFLPKEARITSVVVKLSSKYKNLEKRCVCLG